VKSNEEIEAEEKAGEHRLFLECEWGELLCIALLLLKAFYVVCTEYPAFGLAAKHLLPFLFW
jgi:hypothetical protein